MHHITIPTKTTFSLFSLPLAPNSESLQNVLSNPNAVQGLANAARFGDSANYEQQPANVRARVRALKNLQLQILDIEKKYFQEVHELECKYEKQYEPLMKKRADIVTGRHEPSGKETEFKEDLDEQSVNNNVDNSIKGIPDFWLTVFKNVDKIANTISEADEKILKHLVDVRLNMIENPMGFELEFEFEPNEYFDNKVLKKIYKLANEVDKEAPFNYEGPEVVGCSGTEINWKSDEVNPTKSVQHKLKKNKTKGTVKKVHEEVAEDSFFNFFSPPPGSFAFLDSPLNPIWLAERSVPNRFLLSSPQTVPNPKSEEEYDEEVRLVLEEDFEIGEVLRQAVLHEAVLCYTGEAIIDEEEDFDIYDEVDEDDSDEDERHGHRKGKPNLKNVKGCEQQ